MGARLVRTDARNKKDQKRTCLAGQVEFIKPAPSE